MKDLLVFELKKLMRKKLNIIVVLGSLVLTAMLFISPVTQFISFDKEGNQERGFSGIELEKQLQGELVGVLTEERIMEDIVQYQELFDNPDNLVINDGRKELNNSTFIKDVAPKVSYLRFINNNYINEKITGHSLSEIEKLTIENGADFYLQRDKKVSKLLNANYEDWNYSDQEKEFWIEKNKEVSTPFEYGYHEGWKTVFSCIELMALPIIAICICIAPMFAGEYQSGADNIILSSRYGKSKLIISKLLASFIYALVVYTINLTLGLGFILLSFGIEGWDLPIQIMNSTTPYALTFLSATLVCVITLYLVMFGMISITLLLSAKMKTSFPVLIVMICIIMTPLFFKFSSTNGTWNHIFMLLPYISCQAVFGMDLTDYFSYPFPGFTLDVLTMRVVLYSIISIICVPLAYRAFKKHQVA
ncbi:MAG: ABC transporter permease [Turicibacter sp.]